MIGFVYIADAGELVKIGWSKWPPDRIHQLQSNISSKVTLFGFVPGTKDDERRIHSLLLAWRHRGDWFYKCAATDYLMATFSPYAGFPEKPLSAKTIVARKSIEIRYRNRLEVSKRGGIVPRRPYYVLPEIACSNRAAE